MDALQLQLQMDLQVPSPSSCSGLWNNPLQLTIVIPGANIGYDSASEQSSCSSTPKHAGVRPEEAMCSPNGALSPHSGSSARRVLHCSQSGNYSAVASWLDRQTCMRECARAQLPVPNDNSPAAPAVPEATAKHARSWKSLAALHISATDGTTRNGRAAADANMLYSCNGLPPPAFHLLGLL